MRNLLPMPMPCMVLELLGGPDFRTALRYC